MVVKAMIRLVGKMLTHTTCHKIRAIEYGVIKYVTLEEGTYKGG